jgi:hypothetical protein
MSKWPMRGHFRYLRFKTFPMTPRTPQCEVFWALLSNLKHSAVPEDSKFPTLGVLGFTPTLGQSGVATMTHLNIWNTSYGQTKGRESNWHFDSQPLKVGNRSDFLVCRWRATYRWKVLDKGYNFTLNLISIRGWHTKLWEPKVARIPTQNAIWMWALWKST